MLHYACGIWNILGFFEHVLSYFISEHLPCTSGQFVTKSIWSFFVTDNYTFFVVNRVYARDLFAVGAN